MADDEIKPGEGGRQRDCFYFPMDHQNAATHVRKSAPEVFEWLKKHGGLDDSDESLAVAGNCFRTVMEILPRASLVDHAEVVLILRGEANPMSAESKERFEAAKRRLGLHDGN